jgi:hypothetical protein
MFCQHENKKSFRAVSARQAKSPKSEIRPQRKKMPTLKAIELLGSGTFFHFSRFFWDLKTWHGVCSDFICSETTHGLGHNQ